MFGVKPVTVMEAIAPLKKIQKDLEGVAKLQRSSVSTKSAELRRIEGEIERCTLECDAATNLAAKLAALLS